MTDNDLSCQQIYNDSVQIDAVIARASQSAVAAAPAADPNANISAQVAGAVAQTAIAHGAVRSGFGGFGGLGGGSLLGGLLGGAAQQAVARQQAQGRKEHLTTLFLSKGCRLGDVQK